MNTEVKKTRFPNKAGDHADTDDVLRAELKAAGIPTLQEHDGRDPSFLADIIRRGSGEVKTSVQGHLYGWTFKRAWYYWTVDGPGLDVEAAEELHERFGQEVRVAGHCGCPTPREWYKGFAVTNYHIDTAEGLKALADVIRRIGDANAVKMEDFGNMSFRFPTLQELKEKFPGGVQIGDRWFHRDVLERRDFAVVGGKYEHILTWRERAMKAKFTEPTMKCVLIYEDGDLREFLASSDGPLIVTSEGLVFLNTELIERVPEQSAESYLDTLEWFRKPLAVNGRPLWRVKTSDRTDEMLVKGRGRILSLDVIGAQKQGSTFVLPP